ncbi:uncharacterized protein B0I36DRAFT_359067 [Microdochium trichocladiopsis]|uniref:Putative zinc-finger domain-containing protein n=1 Tax=Microdochium trichocladiopsis TaxID=1682393 RepID=A0A9P8YE65_9PEZI|nr:uncharacterized protein B0I36DRAFT_359067 [Microdochium trichocladiopsis]KAH7037356.1 hypothetical protein B0I36DRAFT_359067 [Microdochium trichocladiopsis]
MFHGQIPGVGAERQLSHDAQQSSFVGANLSPFNMTSPPGLSLTMQHAASNTAAHSLNMIPGLAFGSPPNSRPSAQFATHSIPTAPSSFQRAQSSQTTPSKPVAFISTDSKSGPAQIPSAATGDPGELSEGEFEEEFEDLYEPRDGNLMASTTSRAPQTFPFQRPESTGDADDSSIYDNNTPRLDTNGHGTRLDSPSDEDWEPMLTEAERPSQASRATSSEGIKGLPDSATKNNRPQNIADAKKKAQEAILALWPLKVRYQNYIEEGFDEEVVKTLFKELGLDTNSTKHNQGTVRHAGPGQASAKATNIATVSAVQDGISGSANKSSRPSSPHDQASAGASLGSDSKRVAKSAAEERKDKIARKLAAKSQKPPIPAIAPEPVPSKPPTPSAKPKTRAETNALLHQKLAALKKSQEKAAAERLAAQSTSTPRADEIPSTNPTALSKSNQGFASTSSGVIDVTASYPSTSSATQSDQNPTSANGAISLPASNEHPRVQKRPVAADFDNVTAYPPVTLKRTRTQDTLIIDVSDDEDVEMEIGSPIDDTKSVTDDNEQTGQLAPHRATNGTPTRPEEAHGASTAPAPEGNGKLHLLRGKIEEMRRKIAEAEAKKTGRTPVNTGSPRSGSPMSRDDSTPAGSRKLPKLAELRNNASADDQIRSGRVVSVELLLVESDLKAKQDKLKAIVAEAAKLELEIQETLAQKNKLASEMDSLVSDSGSAQPTGTYGQSALLDLEQAGSSSPFRVDVDRPVILQPATDTPRERPHIAVSDDQPDASQEVGQIVEHQNSKKHEAPREGDKRALQDSGISAPNDGVPTDENPSPAEMSSEVEDGDSDEDDDVSMLSDDDDDDDDDDNRPENAAPRSASDPDENSAMTESVLDGRSLADAGGDVSEEQPGSPPAEADDSDEIMATRSPSLQYGETAVASTQQIPDTEAGSEAALVQDLPQDNMHDRSGPRPEEIASYHSPLEYFRAYRFHPRFFEEVTGGLKSLTYSSKIDVEQMLCPSESVGEECLDSTCEYQHFNKMVLSDGDIITQLGSADMFSGDTKTRFIAGLRKILQELKINKVKDFDRITKAIVQYRADFLADKSKVLPLDGVNI